MRIRIILCIAWAILLFLFLCVWDVACMQGPRFDTRIAADPSWSGFFDLYHSFSPNMQLRKLGHVFGFAVLQFLLYAHFRRYSVSIGLAFAYALVTELAQPIFGRNGLLIDVGVNLVGILLAALIQRLASRTQ